MNGAACGLSSKARGDGASGPTRLLEDQSYTHFSMLYGPDVANTHCAPFGKLYIIYPKLRLMEKLCSKRIVGTYDKYVTYRENSKS